MSADNGIYIACFPNGEYRVAHHFSSVIDELETHYYSPERYRAAVSNIWGESPVFLNIEEALGYAHKLHTEVEYTEYGVQHVPMSVNFGEMKEPTPIPEIPKGACKFCSTPGGTTSYHPVGSTDCRDPSLPHNVIQSAIREVSGRTINENVMTRVVLEALSKAGLQITKK